MLTHSARLIHINDDGSARTWQPFLRWDQVEVLRCAELVDRASPEEPRNACRAFERAEHDRDPPVLSQVRDRLHTCEQ